MSLFVAIVKSFVKNVGNFASGYVGVPIVGDIVIDLWDNWQKETDERTQAELESYARKRMEEAVAEALAAVEHEAPHLLPADREAIVQYLSQVPPSIRRSLRRPPTTPAPPFPPGFRCARSGTCCRFCRRTSPRFKPGDRPLPDGDLELIELLGRGGFGEVWKARHIDRPRLPPVALKFCLDAGAARSLERERDLLDHVTSAGKHDGIVQLLYTHLRANPPCLEYECVEGGDLTGVLHDLHANGLPPELEVAKIVLDLARIVAFAHGQSPAIVHRDLKPANILVRRRTVSWPSRSPTSVSAGWRRRKRSVSGITVRRRPPIASTTRCSAHYTPLYASLEQMRGDQPDPRDDVHALGIIWFQLQTGGWR